MIQRITTGVTRDVFLIGRCAVKLPTWRYGWTKFLQGLLANMQEALWGGPGRYPEICPVFFAIPGGWLIVAGRAEPLGEEEWRAFCCSFDEGDVRDPLRPWINLGADYFIPAERKRDSFGKFGGDIVAVDYGN